jgi:hypothetical protein
MNVPLLGAVDERILMHRLRSTSLAVKQATPGDVQPLQGPS